MLQLLKHKICTLRGTPELFSAALLWEKLNVPSIELNRTIITRCPIALVGPVAKRLKKSALKEDLEEGMDS